MAAPAAPIASAPLSKSVDIAFIGHPFSMIEVSV
jgi:hypothetical protein